MGCCQILFDPAKQGVVAYVCGCGWYGEEPKYVHGAERYGGAQVDYLCPSCGEELLNPEPLILGLVKHEVIDYAASVAQLFLIHSYSPKGCDCDGCKVIKPLIPGFEEIRDRWPSGSYARREGKTRRQQVRRMKINHVDVYRKMVAAFAPSGWTPYTKTTMRTELRLSYDNRSHNAWLSEKSASQLYWEVLRAVHPEMPAKVKWQDYSSKEEYKAAKKANGAEWGKIRDGFYTIMDLLKGKRRIIRERSPWWSDETAEDQVKAIVRTMSKWCNDAARKLADRVEMKRKTAEEIELLRKLAPGGNPVINLEGLDNKGRKALMTKKLQLVQIASAISDLRKIAATRINKVRGRTTSASALMEKCTEGRLKEAGAFAAGIYEMFGDISIRASVIESMRIPNMDWRESPRYSVGLRMIRWERFGIYEKDTWRYRDFKALHATEFFQNPNFDVDAGDTRTEEDGSVLAWDRHLGTWVEIAGPWVDTSLLTKARSSCISSFDMVPYSDAILNNSEDDEDDDDGGDDDAWQVNAYRSIYHHDEDNTQEPMEEVEPEIEKDDEEDSAVA